VENNARRLTGGCLCGAIAYAVTAHVFAGDKAPRFEITGKLPQYEGHVPG